MLQRAMTFAGAAAALVLLAGSSFAQQQEPRVATIVHAGRLLADPATGRVLTQQSILIGADGRVLGVEPGYVERQGATVIDQRNRFVLPGLIDSHVHLTSELSPNQFIEEVTLTSSDAALRGAENARKTLMAGFTTVADLGAANDAIFALRRAIAENRVPGPRIIASGGSITPDGGHGDANGLAPDVLDVLRSTSACSGADACRRATRRQIQAGADVIKITATGGVLSNTAAGVGQQLSDPELEAIVDAAHAMGRRVTAHAHGVGGINAALRAGVDSIEHGSYADAETFRLLRQGNRYLVPTMMAGWWVGQLADQGGTLSPAQAEKARAVGPALVAMARRARAANARIAFGTDTGVSPHGMNAREFQLLVEAGFTPLQAIQMATVNAADHLQLNGTAGRLAAGHAADIIAVDGDPLRDVTTLMNVRFVMARGAVHRAE
ncbi:MAG: Xaa-Pro dipeptidase [Proteobacteria bacterium HN_bin10]|nr:MAG: Xaa-Pro dipeptidase [Proteobacteria bacterium HN_bin10]